jgi:hypothetical protein
MNKLNLNTNDIIVILVIFVVFSIFMYINTYNTYENFKGVALNYDSNEVTNLNKFLETLNKYLDKITELNNNYLDLIKIIKDNDKNIINENLKSKLNTIKTKFNEINNIEYTETDSLFYNFFEIHKTHIFNEYGDFKTSNKICKSEKKYLNNNTYNLDILDDKISIIDLYFNKFKLNDEYKNVMELFSEYRNVLINGLDNFNKIKSLTNKCIYIKEIKKKYNSLKRQFVMSSKNIKTLKENINKIQDIKNITQDNNLPPTNNLEFQTKFCDKLKKLNKPNKSNIIFKRFTNDIIQKKIKYVKKLEDNIKLIQDNLTDKELNNYNLNRLRTDDHATKQYEAITLAINNLKNKNKVKINLT